MRSDRVESPGHARVGLSGLVLVLCACAAQRDAEQEEFVEVGRTQASSEPMPGIELPVAVGDLEAVAERGRRLRAMDRALALATAQMERIGVAPGDIVLPLVDIDDGLRSGQVLFVKWPADAVGDSDALVPAQARRWLLVSLLLDPERLLDVELVAPELVSEQPRLHNRVETLVAVARDLFSTSVAFNLFEVREQRPPEPGRERLVTRVYALAAKAAGPDYELVVEKPRRAKVPTVTERSLVHGAEMFDRDPVILPLRSPAPATVVRILQQNPDGGDVHVQNAEGQRWAISAPTGRISRTTDAEGPY